MLSRKRIVVLLLAGALVLAACTKTPGTRSEAPPRPKPSRPVDAFILSSPSYENRPRIWVVRPDGETTSRTIAADGQLALSPDARRVLYRRVLKYELGISFFPHLIAAQLRELDLDSGKDTVLLANAKLAGWGYDASGNVLAISAENTVTPGRVTDLGNGMMRADVPAMTGLCDIVLWRGPSSHLTSQTVSVAAERGAAILAPVWIDRFVSADAASAWFTGASSSGSMSGGTSALWRLDLPSARLGRVITLVSPGRLLSGSAARLERFAVYDGGVPEATSLGGTAVVVTRSSARSKASGGGLGVGWGLDRIDLLSLDSGRLLRSIPPTPHIGYNEDRAVALSPSADRYLETVPASEADTSAIPPRPAGTPHIQVPHRIVEVDVRTERVTEVVPADYVARPLGYLDDDASFLYRATDGTRGAVFLKPAGKPSVKLTDLDDRDGTWFDGPILLGVRYRD